MSLARVLLFAWLAAFLAVSSQPAPAWAQTDDDDEDGDEEDEEEGDDDDDDDDDQNKGGETKAKPDDDDDDDDDDDKTANFADVKSGPFPGEGRFFFDKPEGPKELEKTNVTGSLTSSTLLFRELSVQLDPNPNGTTETRGASDRVFTDLRAQLTAQHIAGSSYDFRGDLRYRFVPKTCEVDDPDIVTQDPCIRIQSGSFGGQEIDLREIYIARRARSLELIIGRQFVLDLAAHRLDGAMGRYKYSNELTILGFAGLHPQKGSRDIGEDYPTSVIQTDGGTKRIMPATGGGGVAYRYKKLYGALGGIGVLPLVEDSDVFEMSNQLETPRIFVTANGYYRQSTSLDIYHYLVLDLVGSAALSLTNITVGVNARPSPTLRAFAQITRVDTETLAATAQTKLEDPDQGNDGLTPPDQIQNNIEVLRVAQDSARLGLSGGFNNRRYQASTVFTLRQRPEVTLTAPDGTATLTLAAAKDVEAMLRFVDRRSYKKMRVGGQVSRSFGIGANQFQRASTLVVKIDASRVLLDGKAETEGYVSFVQSSSQANAGMSTCGVNATANPEVFEACFAGSKATSVTLGATGFYRISGPLMAIATASLSRQKFNGGAPTNFSDAIYPVSLFLRLAYRF